MRLNIIASTAVRFEPGETKEVELVELGGMRRVYGHNNLVNGDTTLPKNKLAALQKVETLQFKNKEVK